MSIRSLTIVSLLLVVQMCLCVPDSFGQSGGKAMVRGRVLDSLSSAPLGFASIRVYDAGEKTLVNGNITDDDGVFSVDVPFGRYYAVIEFMGYRPLTTGVFSLSGQRDAYDLGRMLL